MFTALQRMDGSSFFQTHRHRSRQVQPQPARAPLAQPYALQGCSSLAPVYAVCPSAPQRLPSVVLPCKICTRALNARYEHGQPLQPTAPSRPLNPSAAASSHLPACVDALEGCTGTLLGLHVDECIYRWCCGECICRYCTRAAQPCCTVADTPSVQVGHLPIGHFGDTQHAGCWLVVGGLRAFFAVARSKSDPPRSFGLTPPLQDLSFEVAVEVMNKNKHVRI